MIIKEAGLRAREESNQEQLLESAFGYTGEQEDESGLLFLRARYYDAETGRFLSQDTWKGETTRPQTQHLYNYVIGNPVNYVDPTGHYIDLGVGSNAPRNMHDFSTGYHVSYNDNYIWKENDPRCHANQYCEVEAGVSLFAAAVAPGVAQYLLLEGGAVATSQWIIAQGTVYGNSLLTQFPTLAQAGAALWLGADLADNVAMTHAAATGNQEAVSELWLTSNIDGNYPFTDAIGGIKYFGGQAVAGCSVLIAGYKGTKFGSLNDFSYLQGLVEHARSLVSFSSRSPTFAWVQSPQGTVLTADSSFNNIYNVDGQQVDMLERVSQRAEQINVPLPPSDKDRLSAGQFYGSHADKIVYELSPNSPIGISHPIGPCIESCQPHFRGLAINSGHVQTIAYPYRNDMNNLHTFLFSPSGEIAIVSPSNAIYMLPPLKNP